MKDFDSIWRTQDEIRTVVNAVLGECIWNLSFNERRMAIDLLVKRRELPFLRIPVSFFEGICRGKTYLVICVLRRENPQCHEKDSR